MAEQTQQAVETKVEETPKDFMLTKDGVVVLGTDYLGGKLTGLCLELIKAYKDSVALVEFRVDNFPQDAEGPVFGMAFADAHCAAINLEHCWHRACKTAHKGEEKLSFLGILWINILSAVGHELDHLDAAHRDRTLYETMRTDEEECKLLEDTASDEALKAIVKLAREYDCEIPSAEDFGWFGTKLMELFATDSTKDLDWVKLAQKHIEDGIVYDEGEDKQCKTFRQFVQLAHDPESKQDWEQPVVFVDLVSHMAGDIAVLKVDIADQPKAIDVAEETVETEPIEMVADQATGMFVGAGEGEEAITVVDDQPAEAQTEAVITNPVEAAQAGMMAGVAAMTGQDTVPLPTTVAAEQAVVANAAIPPTPAALPQTYEPNNVDMNIMPALMQSIWQRLYHHVFTKCGWAQNPQTGRFMFTNAVSVLEQVNIQDIIDHFGAANFVKEYDTVNAQGQDCGEEFSGYIRGHLSQKAKLPMYSIYLNINGQRVKRVLVPQNPDKMNAQNAYSVTAAEAGQGHMIAWVGKDAPMGASFKEKYAAKIKDNNYEIIA